jgi:hypothetical protein
LSLANCRALAAPWRDFHPRARRPILRAAPYEESALCDPGDGRPEGDLALEGLTMRLVKFVIACALFSVAYGAVAVAESCKEPEAGSDSAPLFSPPHANVVIGKGRLQFYSAPNPKCAIEGVFVIPKDELISYAETNGGWASVMYANPSTGKSVTGWVRASRLRETGNIGPRQ